MLETLYVIPILTGITILAVFGYLKWLATRTSRTILEIIQLNEQLQYDPYKFIAEAFKLLEKTHIQDYAYKISCLGSTFERKMAAQKKSISKSINGDEFSIYIEIVPRKPMKGEKKYVYLIILENLFLLLKIDVLVKIWAVNKTFSDIAKLQARIEHDLKNIAQFAKVLAYNMQNLENQEDEHRFVTHLRDACPALLLRANNILNALQVNHEEERGLKRHIDVRKELENLLCSYELKCKVEGKASVYAEEARVMFIFDNLLKNIYEKSLKEDIEATIKIYAHDGMVSIAFCDTGSHVEGIEKIFEPFCSEKKGGLGVGLFQVRSLLETMGGRIEAKNMADGVCFDVVIPDEPNKPNSSKLKGES